MDYVPLDWSVTPEQIVSHNGTKEKEPADETGNFRRGFLVTHGVLVLNVQELMTVEESALLNTDNSALLL
ncbi:hypothetical protein [Gimesia aquarii]|uniref:Uncharacterized protein n=1 Tax=Gimesia aquarii TaxID=2527964 RepID=A0A517X056_9PLAN|nr:hypothetical protein [Gimesia aquarii]QDU10883.1 hypothetical protein V202x_42960 [Gimesia aquarii]